MPPPADLESAASLPLVDNTVNHSIRKQSRRHPAHQKCSDGSELGSRLIECRKWWCENAQCHWVCFVMCLFGEGRRQGKRRSWWNDYIVAERGGGGAVLNSWHKPSLFNTVLLHPGVQCKERWGAGGDALHPSLVLLVVHRNKHKKQTMFLTLHNL